MASSTNALFRNVEFSDQITLANQTRFSDCKFLTSSCDISNTGITTITGSVFDEATISTEFETLINNCIFENHTVTSDIVFVDGGQVLMDSCIARNMSASSGTIFDFNASGGQVSNCMFGAIVLSGTAKIISATSTINCIFEGNTYTTNSAVQVTSEFTNNVLSGGTGEALITAGTFANNTGFHAVDGTSLRIVDGNIFAGSSTIGFNIDLTGVGDTIVSNNRFATIPASGDAISCGATSTGAKIIGNHFLGTDNTSNAVALTNAPDMTVSDNTFDTCSALSMSAQVTGLSVVGNRLSATAEIWQVGDDFTLANNIKGLAKLTLNGGLEVDDLKVTGNQFLLSLEINCPMRDSLIFGNSYGTYIQQSNMINSIISSNTGSFSTDIGQLWTTVLFTENVGRWLNTSNVTIRESIISENFIFEADITFTIDSTGGNQPALVNISGNMVTGNVNITAINEIDQLGFTDNLSRDLVAPITPLLTISKHINNAFISRNVNFGITISDGADSTIISLNSLSTQDITLNGSITNTSVDNNFVSRVIADCDSLAGGLSIKNNTVFDSIDIFDDNTTTYGILGAKINDNKVVNDITIGQNGVPVGSESKFTASTINNNKADNILFYPGDGYMDMSSNTIASNNVGNIQFFNATDDFDRNVVTIANLNIVGNTISGVAGLVFDGGISGAADGPQLVDIVITGNNISSFVIGSFVGILGLTVTNNKFDTFNITYEPRTAGETYQNILIGSNIIKSDSTMSIAERIILQNFSFVNNMMPNVDLVWDTSAATAGGVFLYYCVISNNSMRAIDMSFGDTYLGIDRFILTNNMFSGDSAAVKGGGAPEPGFFFESTSSGNTAVFSRANVSGNTSGRQYPFQGLPADQTPYRYA